MATQLFGASLFQVMTVEDWPEIARGVLAQSPYAWIFFATYLLIAALALLFLAGCATPRPGGNPWPSPWTGGHRRVRCDPNPTRSCAAQTLEGALPVGGTTGTRL